MPTPCKPVAVLLIEKRSHRTKAELSRRNQGESALSTGRAMKERSEVKNNPIAHKEFKRINDLLKKINKNDALYEAVINRYCMIQAECIDFYDKMQYILETAEDLKQAYNALENNLISNDRKSIKANIAKIYTIQSYYEKLIQTKRKMLLEIEKENIMTIASALRTIPQKVDTEEKDPLIKILRGER